MSEIDSSIYDNPNILAGNNSQTDNLILQSAKEKLTELEVEKYIDNARQKSQIIVVVIDEKEPNLIFKQPSPLIKLKIGIEADSIIEKFMCEAGLLSNFWRGDPETCELKNGFIYLKSAQKQIISWSNTLWDISFKLGIGVERYLVNISDANLPPRIDAYCDKEVDVRWDLADNPQKWEFVPSVPFHQVHSNPNSNKSWMIREIFKWSRRPGFNQSVRYFIKSLRFRFYEANESYAKSQLRALLDKTLLNLEKPFVKLSLARQAFAREVYSWLPLAERSFGENHLWFCLEYSQMLKEHKPNKKNTSKNKERKRLTAKVNTLRNAMKKREIPATPFADIDVLTKEGLDWREHIEDLLLFETLKVICDNPKGTKELQDDFNKYLRAISQYNAAVNTSPKYFYGSSGRLT